MQYGMPPESWIDTRLGTENGQKSFDYAGSNPAGEEPLLSGESDQQTPVTCLNEEEDVESASGFYSREGNEPRSV